MFGTIRNLLLALSVLLLFSVQAYSAEKRVIVLPFKIIAKDDMQYLKTEIPEMIGRNLSKSGASIIKKSSFKTFTDSGNLGKIINLGRENKADYIIWGEARWENSKISLTSNIIRVKDQKKPEVVFSSGEGIENFLKTVNDLSFKLGNSIFKREKINEIVINGNKRIESDAILRVIDSQKGSIFNRKTLGQDLKSIYGMGYFANIIVEVDDQKKDGITGKTVTFTIKEKPTLREIILKGTENLDPKTIRELLTLSTGSILNIYNINKNINLIKDFYKKKSYHNIKVKYKIHPLKENNLANLELILEEGDKVEIQTITFVGNSSIIKDDLLDLMDTGEKTLWSWLSSANELDPDKLSNDVIKISEHYKNNGFVDAKVGEPEIVFKDGWIYVTIKIQEGFKYKLNSIDFDGELIQPKEDLKSLIKMEKGEPFSRAALQKDIVAIHDIYSDEGHAYASIYPSIKKNPKTKEIDLVIKCRKGPKVFFEKIIIKGNTVTRDKVIRRQLKVYEQELYNGKKLKRSVRNLYKLGFFEDIKVNTLRGKTPDAMVLSLDVKEKRTGSFIIGGGYSTESKLTGQIKIQKENLFGRGQTLNFAIDVSETNTKYSINFNEPWMFDIPLSTGFSLYKKDNDYSDTYYYEKETDGGSISLGYTIFQDTRVFLSFKNENTFVTITDSTEVSSEVLDIEGDHTTRSLRPTLLYDSTDSRFTPTEGFKHKLSMEYAGGALGGTIGYRKYLAETGFYFPIFWKFIGTLHGKAGFIETNDTDDLMPDYERFTLGGRTLRGFKSGTINVTDSDGDDIGGDKYVLFNAEITFPLYKKAGLYGVFFYDTGNVFDEGVDIDFEELRETAGWGIRWQSPMGPMRFEWGYILDDKPGDDESVFNFSIGSLF
jgi:outer membrane protein insertion porin family